MTRRARGAGGTISSAPPTRRARPSRPSARPARSAAPRCSSSTWPASRSAASPPPSGSPRTPSRRTWPPPAAPSSAASRRPASTRSSPTAWRHPPPHRPGRALGGGPGAGAGGGAQRGRGGRGGGGGGGGRVSADNGAGPAYAEFLRRKSQQHGDAGFEPLWLPPFLYAFQRALTEWALRRARAAIFADCGLGKTPMQLVWAENVVRKANRPVLILTPLAVGHQTVREGEKFGVECVRSAGPVKPGARIVVTNYEKIHHFQPAEVVNL